MDLEQVYYAYRDKVFGFFVKNLSDQELARDLTQEVFLKLCSRKDKLADIKCFDRYIYLMCRNLTVNHLNKAARDKKYREYLVHAWNNLNIRGKSSTEHKIDADHYRAIVQQSLDLLPPRQQQIFTLSKQQGWSNQRIARKLGLSPNTVKNHLHQAMKNLRSSIPDIEIIVLILGVGLVG